VAAVFSGTSEVVAAVCCGTLDVVAAVFSGTPEVVAAVFSGTPDVEAVVFSGTAAITLVAIPTGVDMLSSFPHVFDVLLSFCRILSCAKVGDTAAISNGDWLRDLQHNSFKFSLVASNGNSNAS